MWTHNLSKPVLFIVGPTASGKTDLSIRLAVDLKTEIISADSRYFYRMMDIGTAKPSRLEIANIKHHMIDIADPGETISVALFKQMVTEIINDFHDQNKMPIVVGGTGQYIHALIQNWEMPTIESDPRLRDILEDYANQHGKIALYDFLKKIDPEAAKIIDYRNLRRTIRAIEVILKTGKLFSNQRTKGSSLYTQKIIGLHWERSVLYQRIDDRIEMMLSKGFIEEVSNLINRGYSNDLPSMSAIGYRELAEYIQGKISLDEAIMLIKRKTRQYVRRQANWFKKDDPLIKWFDGEEVYYKYILDYVKSSDGWVIPG